MLKTSLSREKLLKVLTLVSGAVERRQTFPILANVMLIVDKKVLSVKATDLEVELIGRVELDSADNSPGETTVMARKLIDICRSLSNDALVTLKLEKERLLIQSEKSHFTLAVLPTKGFPSMEQGKNLIEFLIPQYQLKKAINKTYFSIGQEDVRYYLNGLLFDMDQGVLKLTGADGHRLSMVSLDLPALKASRTRFIVPRKGILELMRLLEDNDTEAKVGLGTNHITLKTADFTFISKLIDVQAPFYERAIPVVNDKTVIVDRDKLKQALARVSILSSEKYHGVRLSFKNNVLKISANNPEQEEAEEEIEIIYAGDEFERGYNVNYLLDVCNTLEEGNIKMNFFNVNDSLLIIPSEEEKNCYFIMPLRL